MLTLALSTWHDLAVQYWELLENGDQKHAYEEWRKSSTQERYAYEKQYLYGRKCPIPSSMGYH